MNGALHVVSSVGEGRSLAKEHVLIKTVVLEKQWREKTAINTSVKVSR